MSDALQDPRQVPTEKVDGRGLTRAPSSDGVTDMMIDAYRNGPALARWAELLGVERQSVGETDAQLRERMSAILSGEPAKARGPDVMVDDPPANDNSPPLTCGVDRHGGETWCGKAWGSSFRVTNDRERVSCPGCRAAATEPATLATVEAEVRRACAAYSELREVVFGYKMVRDERWLSLNGRLVRLVSPSNESFDKLRCSAARIARYIANHAKYDRRPCALCRGSFSLLCHACKGGVGS